MNEAEFLGIPVVPDDRVVAQAHAFIDEHAAVPSDSLRRRRAVKFLGELTRFYLTKGFLPQEALPCFWRLLEVSPAYVGQADSLGILDHGPRAPLVAAMAEGAEALRLRARQWACGLGRLVREPRHLLLTTLPFSGASAIVPVVKDYLTAEDFMPVDDFWALPEVLAAADARGKRVFAWVHGHYEYMEPYLRRPDVTVVYLHRDPRDVVISSLQTDAPSIPTLFAAILGYRLDELWPESVPFWQELAAIDPATWVTTFPTMKADVPGCAQRILRMLDLPVDEARVRELADAYSFKAMAGHKEGEGATFKRLGPYVVRKGTSGQWRERFDRTCALFFAAKYGHLLLAGGWAADMDWIDEVQG